MSKREDILNTALELFIDKGFDNTPTSLISKEASVATGTLFHHFKSKEELINELYLHLKKDIHQTLQVDTKKMGSVREKIEFIWLEITKWGIANPGKYKFLNMAKTSPYIEENTREQIETLFSDIYSVIDDGYKQGIFQILPRVLFLSILSAHLDATVTYFIENPMDFKNKKTVRGAFESYWRTLTK